MSSLRQVINSVTKDSKDEVLLDDETFDKKYENFKISSEVKRTISNNNFSKTETVSRSTSINFVRVSNDGLAHLTPAARWVEKYQKCVENRCDCFEFTIPETSQLEADVDTSSRQLVKKEGRSDRMQQLVERMNKIQQDMIALQDDDADQV